MNIPEEAWFKSSYSDDQGGNCVEVVNLPTHTSVAVRDSKLPHGPIVTLPPDAFAAFVDHLRHSRCPW
ncbi:DUF397 domain-containing protein [Streptomyces sp. NL15-2K]|uniref:DUF397 domain-containing protein n=1 Tax=Streptomyces sp. NL15-2K TaxID=376149 RepID=UPI000F5675DA|nr:MULTISPECIES: DUF397 domain-containing protein [Actinomycetes]WKX08818.1 DUF397 domain-containing protein [Kutzneria buriramensis]GCB53250.1 hypothetical protein SNL152K_10607 [Streptomyces sp. NL15-2K]